MSTLPSYTERPDLFLAEVEKHDPGFINRMNEGSVIRAERDSDARFYFGKVQAWVSMGVAVIAALAILLFVGITVLNGRGFWSIIALGVLYAITQGGPSGFNRLIRAIATLFNNVPRGDKD